MHYCFKSRVLFATVLITLILFLMVACSDDGDYNGGRANTTPTSVPTAPTAVPTAPTAVITRPTDGAIYTYGDVITFTGSGTDAETGDLSGASLVWTSDLDGEVGIGASFTLNNLSWGDHTITLTATDSDAASGSDTISISVKAWAHPSSPSDNISPDQNAWNPQVAMDGNGNAVITWYQSDGNDFQIFKSECRNGEWTHPADLTDNISPNGQETLMPQVAMDGNGNAIITWMQSDGNDFQIFKSEYRGGIWTHPTSFTDSISPDGEIARAPQVAMDGNGNAVITWQQSDGSYWQTFKSDYRNGVWTHPSSLSDNITPDGQGAYDPQAAMDGNGNAVITWEQYDGSQYQIFKSEYRNGAWTHPADLTDNISPDGQDAVDPQVAMDGSGDAVITWMQSNGSYSQVFKSEYRNGVWSHPTGLTDNISPDGQDAVDPRVAMDGNGNAVVTWQQSDGSNDQIFKSEYRNGAWSHPTGLTDNISPDGQDAVDPQVAMDGNGNAVITWEQYDGSRYQIFKSEYRNGAWTHPSSLTDNISPDGQPANSPQMAMDGNGNAVITWRQYDGSRYQIFKSEYN